MSDSRVNPSRIWDVTSPAIEVTVGLDSAARIFYVHKDLICSSSAYFKTIMDKEGQWRDCRNGQVLLEEEDPDIFAIYLHWLYFGRFELGTPRSSDVDQQAKSPKSPDFLQLAKANVLGDFIGDSKFVRDAAAAIRTKVDSMPAGPSRLPGAGVIDCIYNKTGEESTARKTLVEIYVRDGNREWLAELAETEDFIIPWQFLYDMLREKLPEKLPFRTGRTGTYESVGHAGFWCTSYD